MVELIRLFQKLWAELVAYARRVALVDFNCPPSDTATGKAASGDHIGPNPKNRAKNGTNWSTLIEGGGQPIWRSSRPPTATTRS